MVGEAADAVAGVAEIVRVASEKSGIESPRNRRQSYFLNVLHLFCNNGQLSSFCCRYENIKIES